MFFSSAYGSLSRIEHTLGHKRGLNKFKETEIASGISSDYKGMKIEINYKKSGKSTNMWRSKTMLLNNQWVKENQTEIEKYSDTNENRSAMHKNIQCSKAALREVKKVLTQTT